MVTGPRASLREALEAITKNGRQAVLVADAEGVLFLEEQIAAPPLPTPAVIMAGGEGRRLRPLTDSTPKPLVLVGGKPLVEIMIEWLRRSGITDIVIALHHRSEMIRDRLGDGGRLGVRLDYAFEPKPLRAMWEFHRRQGNAAMTVGVSTHQVDIPYGEFTLHGERVTRVEEKPHKEFPVNAGIYLLDPSAIELIPPGEYFDATHMIRTLLDPGASSRPI